MPPTTHDDAPVPDESEAWALGVRDRQSWLALIAVSTRLIPHLDAHHKQAFGLSHVEYSVLIIIADSRAQQCELTALARRVNSSLSRMSHLVRRLEKDGLVTLASSHADRRVTVATLTSTGRRLLDHAAPLAMAEARRLAFDPLSAEQQRQLAEICLTLLKSWSPDDPHPWLI